MACTCWPGDSGGALIGNSAPYTSLNRPWGNHPSSDHYLGRDHFPVDDDGGEAPRWQKAETVADWPEAMRYLRVCFQNPGSHLNCGLCEKCVRTLLSFRAAGVPEPQALPHAIEARQIRRLRFTHIDQDKLWIELIEAAGQHGFSRSDWVDAARRALRYNRRRRRLNRVKAPFIPLRNRLRTLFRGSPLSRRELAQSLRRR